MTADKFFDEVDGGLVRYLRTDAQIRNHVGGNDQNDTAARIFLESARQGAKGDYLVYTQVAGSTVTNHSGADSTRDVALHIYAYSKIPNDARRLANRVHDFMVGKGTGVDIDLPDGTKLQVCNGSVVDSGHEEPREASGQKHFWVRLVLRFLIS